MKQGHYIGAANIFTILDSKRSLLQRICNTVLGPRDRSPTDWRSQCFAVHSCLAGFRIRYAGEDTWIECLAELGRYRMAIWDFGMMIQGTDMFGRASLGVGISKRQTKCH